MALAVAGVAAGILTTSGAVKVPEKVAPATKLATQCQVPYDKQVYKELRNVFNKQADALNRLGLGTTEADVCNEVQRVASEKKNSSIQPHDYISGAHTARAVLSAAILYRVSLQEHDLSRSTLQSVGAAFEVPKTDMQVWTPEKMDSTIMNKAAIQSIRSNLFQTAQNDIAVTNMKDSKFGEYVYDLNIAP